ncbi:MAG: PDZ domain-containing protein [Actinobacteria bacterium]|nr:MAG: PDZ domain-containing protein [Actinomycetota bacterium]TML48474.1 MAG: PDZ domain-containing protein [Actinomycetota bacterium]
MSIAIAILGLGLLVLVHEAGHFFASLAVGLRPRRFYLGFPPALVKVKRRGIEYGIGVVPLGGFVTIPGMHRPISHDAERRFSRAVSEVPALAGPYDRVRRALDGEDTDAALAAVDELEQALRERRLSPEAASSAGRGLTELRDALGPDAYWKAATWRRLVAILAGPGANVLLAIVLLTVLFMTGSVKPSRIVAGVESGSPAQKAGIQAGDRVVAINGARVTAENLPDAIVESHGRPLTVTIERDGRTHVLPKVTAMKTPEGYRLGIVRKGVGVGPGDAFVRSVKWTGIITKEMGVSLGHLAQGQGRKDVSSPIGIVQGSADAVKQGTSSYLWVLSLVSLSLALLNLLPLLPLDGGHILFTLIEGARGRLVRREIYERVSFVGLALVLLLFFLGLSNDISGLS